MIKKYFLIPLLLFGSISFAQRKVDVVPKPEWKRDTVIGDNVFKIYSNWVTGGAGIAKNSKIPSSQFVLGVDFNFHITNEYFQTGFLLSGDEFSNYNNQQLHICYGKRKENLKFNFAYFGGLSYSRFYVYENNKYSLDYSSSIGLYINAQLIRKLTYDVGIGISGFADVNFEQNLFGIKADLYFSGAYKGKKKD